VDHRTNRARRHFTRIENASTDAPTIFRISGLLARQALPDEERTDAAGLKCGAPAFVVGLCSPLGAEPSRS
jgi:hypothetical protein